MTTKKSSVTKVKSKSPTPDWVPPHLTDTYQQIMRHLQESAGYVDADESLVRQFIEALDNLRQCQQIVKEEGVVAVSPQGQKVHPALSAQTALNATLTKIGGMLGLGPAHRKRLSFEATKTDSSKPSNPWAV